MLLTIPIEAESNHAPFGKLEALAVLNTNPYGAGIIQAIGPLKTLSHGDSSSAGRFLIVTDVNDPSQLVLRQTNPPTLH